MLRSERVPATSWLVLTVVVVCGLLWHANAFAQDSAPIDLKWSAPDACPSAAWVLARVRQIAGKAGERGARLRIEATVTEPSSGKFHLHLVMQAGNDVGVRNVDGASCKDLAGAAAVSLAILVSSDEPLSGLDRSDPTTNPTSSAADTPPAVDPPALATTPPRSPLAPAPAEPPPPAPRTGAPPPADSGDQRRRRFLLELPLASLNLGLLREPSVGLGLGLGLALGHWQLLLEGTRWSSQRFTTVHLADEYGAALNHLSADARGCYPVWGGRFELAPCAMVLLHHLSAHGSGPNLQAHTAGGTWVAVGTGMQARFAVAPWLSLLARIDGEIETVRPEVQLQGSADAFGTDSIGSLGRVSPAAFTVTIGSQWIL
ncbi:MAG: hypothetical protein ABI488_02140 [Polyangiaceae bacterium]